MEDSAQNTEEHTGSLQKLKDSSLKAAALTYLIGDAAIITSGIAAGNKSRRNTGLFWAAGSMPPILFGDASTEKQLRMLSEGLGNYLRKQGVAIPDDPTIADLTKEGGVVEHTLNFFRKHPSEGLNVIYGMGATQMIAGGIKEAAKGSKKTGISDIVSGALVGAGALAGLLIKEKKPDPDTPPLTTGEKVRQWVQEKPLRVTGILYQANNLAMLAGAYSKMSYAKKKSHGSVEAIGATKDFRLRLLTASAYIVANTMLAISSKNYARDGENDIASQVADVGVRIIAAQPKEVQAALVQQVSGYLAGQPEINKSADEIAAMLNTKLQQVPLQPVQQPTWQERTQAVMSGPDSPQLT